ncbi:hypothetical protein KJS93_21140 [Flavihumibacter fluvii]|nr:hypothetical protein [Flavihumibacter fluvii]ULQ54862.1 hypothetical protein KJS93_21140 [Flavihumibacter fluvii]
MPWQDLWLIEGFATFMTNHYLEKIRYQHSGGYV